MTHRHAVNEAAAHAGHDHSHHRTDAAPSVLGWALLFVLGFGVLEVVVGILSGSLALASDGVHMLTDAAALGLAWGAQWISRREAGPQMSFGYGRAEPLAALLNGVFYLGVLAFIVVEAIARLRTPTEVATNVALPVAIVGLLVNVAVWRMLHARSHELNTRGALLHVIGDFAGSVIAIVALLAVRYTGWSVVDPLLTLAISALLLVSTVRLLRESIRVLMNAVPAGMDPAQIEETLRAAAGVRSVHDLHLWSLGDGRPALSAHVTIDDVARWPAILAEIRATMQEHHGIAHLTLQPGTPLDEALLHRQEAQCRRRA